MKGLRPQRRELEPPSDLTGGESAAYSVRRGEPSGSDARELRVDVLVGHRVVGVVPIHPVAQANGLLRLDAGEPADPLLAALDEPGDAERFDVPLGLEAQFLLDLDLHPQPPAAEAAPG